MKWTTDKMKRMGSLIKIVDHQVNPNPSTRNDGELIPIPLRPGKTDHRPGRVSLRAPGCSVDEPVRHIVVSRQLLDFRIHDVGLVRLGGQHGQDGARRGDSADVDSLAIIYVRSIIGSRHFGSLDGLPAIVSVVICFDDYWKDLTRGEGGVGVSETAVQQRVHQHCVQSINMYIYIWACMQPRTGSIPNGTYDRSSSTVKDEAPWP